MFDNKATDIPKARKRFIGVKFDCCQVYTRIYANKDETSFEGRCPKCLRKVSIKTHKKGVNLKWFSAFNMWFYLK